MEKLYRVTNEGVLKTFEVVSEDVDFAQFFTGENHDVIVRIDGEYHICKREDFADTIEGAFADKIYEVSSKLTRINKAYNAFLA